VSVVDRVSSGVNPGQVTAHSGLGARVRLMPGGLRALDWPSARSRWWASSWAAQVGREAGWLGWLRRI
jgi:hypothetical protein